MTSVMIVENSEKPCQSVKKLLSSINYEIVFLTSNGYEAIEKYGIVKPDLLLLDITLSKHDKGNSLNLLSPRQNNSFHGGVSGV